MVTPAIGRLLGEKAGPGAPSVNIPVPPSLTPAQSPTAKPGKKGMQQSFLSGVAGGGLTPGAGGTTGKTLLGQ